MSALARLLEQATPGPWESADTDEHGWIVDAISVGMTVAETTKKDARLIALAPDMAGLLIDMADVLDNLSRVGAIEGVETPLTDSLLARFAELEQRAAP